MAAALPISACAAQNSAPQPQLNTAEHMQYMNGYTDGTFRPDNAVTLEEACTAVLKLLGYKMTDLNGAFPAAQLNKAQELGLRSQLNRHRARP